MINRIRLINFKVSKDIDCRIAPLTVLSGLNGSGKSTLLQSIGIVKQSYDVFSSPRSLTTHGPLVQLGKWKDILHEGATNDLVGIEIVENGISFKWKQKESRLIERPDAPPSFLATSDFQFIQADRIVPKTFYPQTNYYHKDGFLGAKGEYTIDFLATSNLKVNAARCVTSNGDKLIEKIAPTHSLIDQTNGWLQTLSPGVKLIPETIKGTDEVKLKYNYLGRLEDSKSNDYRPANVGFGLTYCLPVIVACLSTKSNGLVLLENPEAHLHPKGQGALGELISRCASDGLQIVVETHSDHILNGIRVAVRNKIIQSKDVALNFFTRRVREGDAYIQTPTLMDDGSLTNWPDGFFDQWDKSIDALIG